MPTSTNEQPFERGPMLGIQRKTTKFQKEQMDVDLIVNGGFKRIGGVEKVLGMSKVGNAITETTTSTSTSTSSSTTSSTSSSSTTTMA
jgi:hypothetical protein